jgi:D-methionine transport system ATP-binding protein
MIELTNLHKSYLLPDNNTVSALKGVNLSVKRGEIFGVIGQSGAGKSTLIRCINRLETPDAGVVRVDGQNLLQLDKNQLRTARRHIGMIFQHFNLLSSSTVYQNIALPLALAGEKTQHIQTRVHSLLDLVGLFERKNHYPSELSGGQKQRVAIARALANHPRVLLSDESTSALDPETKHNILQLLKKINAELAVTILLITHEMGVIKEICHRLAILEQGLIVDEASVADFFSNPQTETAKKFARTFALKDLPEKLRVRWLDQPNETALPLWRLSFLGSAAEAPLISQLSRLFALDLSILQAQIEQIRDEMVGVLVVEVTGTPENIAEGKRYLYEKGVAIEEVGYVRPVA